MEAMGTSAWSPATISRFAEWLNVPELGGRVAGWMGRELAALCAF